MFFGESELRKKLTKLAEEAYIRANFHASGATELYDKIGTLPGMAILERRNPYADAEYQCAQYVFGARKRELWCPVNGDAPEELWESPEEFLTSQGYKLVTTPDRLDVVGYRTSFNRPNRIKHWGLFVGPVVNSKLDRGHIYKHAPEMVPLDYADNALFFRKLK